MFPDSGELFYPAYPGDPYYDDFITRDGAILPPDFFPGGGPTGLAEFFGDFMVVNGVIWPREDVEPRRYRPRLLNGTDSRFMALQFFEVPPGQTDPNNAIDRLGFTVIGSDQGLASSPTTENPNLGDTEEWEIWNVTGDGSSDPLASRSLRSAWTRRNCLAQQYGRRG